MKTLLKVSVLLISVFTIMGCSSVITNRLASRIDDSKHEKVRVPNYENYINPDESMSNCELSASICTIMEEETGVINDKWEIRTKQQDNGFIKEQKSVTILDDNMLESGNFIIEESEVESVNQSSFEGGFTFTLSDGEMEAQIYEESSCDILVEETFFLDEEEGVVYQPEEGESCIDDETWYDPDVDLGGGV